MEKVKLWYLKGRALNMKQEKVYIPELEENVAKGLFHTFTGAKTGSICKGRNEGIHGITGEMVNKNLSFDINVSSRL